MIVWVKSQRPLSISPSSWTIFNKVTLRTILDDIFQRILGTSQVTQKTPKLFLRREQNEHMDQRIRFRKLVTPPHLFNMILTIKYDLVFINSSGVPRLHQSREWNHRMQPHSMEDVPRIDHSIWDLFWYQFTTSIFAIFQVLGIRVLSHWCPLDLTPQGPWN